MKSVSGYCVHQSRLCQIQSHIATHFNITGIMISKFDESTDQILRFHEYVARSNINFVNNNVNLLCTNTKPLQNFQLIANGYIMVLLNLSVEAFLVHKKW